MNRFLKFLTRGHMILLTVLLAVGVEWVSSPGCPHKWLHITVMSVFAGGMWLFPKIPPDDMHIKP